MTERDEVSTPREAFEAYAPMIDAEDLSSMILNDVMTDRLRSRAASLWLIGGFADPARPLGTTEDRWSDLDVFIVDLHWDMPQAETGIALETTHTTLPDQISENAEGEWNGVSGPEQWGCSADEAWDQLPEYVQETLIKGTHKLIFRSRKERESLRPRYLDLFVGNEEQLAYQRKLGRTEGYPLPGFCLWRA